MIHDLHLTALIDRLVTLPQVDQFLCAQVPTSALTLGNDPPRLQEV
jgi:hypothetical protein